MSKPHLPHVYQGVIILQWYGIGTTLKLFARAIFTLFSLFDGFERLPKQYLKTEIYIVRSPKIQN